jgi:hypothetical protein
MVFQSASLKFNPEMTIIWSWSPNCRILCIDFGWALGTCYFFAMQNITLEIKWASIHMPDAILTYNFYHL